MRSTSNDQSNNSHCYNARYGTTNTNTRMNDEGAAVGTCISTPTSSTTSINNENDEYSNHDYHSNPNLRLLPSRNMSKRKILIHNTNTTSNARNTIDMITPSKYNIDKSNMVDMQCNNNHASNFNDNINVGQGNSRYTTTASSTMNNETAFLCTPMNDEVSSNDYYRANHTTSFNPNQHCRQSSTSRSTRSLPRSVNEITPNYYVNERSDIVSATKRNNEYNNEYPQSCTSR